MSKSTQNCKRSTSFHPCPQNICTASTSPTCGHTTNLCGHTTIFSMWSLHNFQKMLHFAVKSLDLHSKNPLLPLVYIMSYKESLRVTIWPLGYLILRAENVHCAIYQIKINLSKFLHLFEN